MLIHHACRIAVRPPPTMKPHDIRLGSPSPRKDSEDSSRIAVATISEASTTIGDRVLGRISRRRMVKVVWPVTTAAWT